MVQSEMVKIGMKVQKCPSRWELHSIINVITLEIVDCKQYCKSKNVGGEGQCSLWGKDLGLNTQIRIIGCCTASNSKSVSQLLISILLSHENVMFKRFNPLNFCS
ncbi:hypothetical protein [Methanobacterium aggregans]|uniref:hypothetical protein n=1 Tax=Methanobacterium aggregans TaxID=1615586 RepID=UPI001AE11465|nr:hypothetical protein [Methanobacterium aggregans]MBP2045276.1 hypothetical protein [Methanobacterium aggregans]